MSWISGPCHPEPERRVVRSSFCVRWECVEVEFIDHGVRVRGSGQETDEHLFFSFDEWQAFIAGVKNGEFDLDRLRGQS